MSRFDRIATVVLIGAGAIAIVAGLVIVVLAHTLTRSRVETSNTLLKDNLETARRVAGALQEHSDSLETIGRVPQHAAATTRRLPPLLQASTDTLRGTVVSIRQSAAALQSVETGADFLTPGSPVSQQADSLQTLAEQLSELRQVLLETREPVGALSDQIGAAAAAQQTLRDALAEAGVGPEMLVERLERTLELQRGTDLAAATAWQQTSLGGGYLLLGLLLAGLGGFWRRLADGDVTVSLPPSER